MAFKTAAEIFGDGGGFGPAVPYATTNPPGTNATNRGIQFGEQLTAAIANRTHYALALNDEDLNTRLSIFETGGLDAAYDNGTIGPAGGGREITKNGGAVETISTLATQYADDIANAHFRANALLDTTAGGGFDFRGGSFNAYGMISRQSDGIGGAYTTLAASAAVTLNPGGAGGDVIRYGAGTVSVAGNTDLGLDGLDFIEVTGAGVGVDGLYVVFSLGPVPATDVRVRRLNGVAPAFGVTVAATARLFHADMMSSVTGRALPSGGFAGLALGGRLNYASVLALFGNDIDNLIGTGCHAVHFVHRDRTGTQQSLAHLTSTGRLKSSVNSDVFQTDARTLEWAEAGIPIVHVDKAEGGATGYHEIGMLVREQGGLSSSWAGLETRGRILETTTFGINNSIPGTFAAPMGRIILPDSDGVPAPPAGQLKSLWALFVQPGATLVRILTGSGAGRYYLLSAVNLTAAGPNADEIVVTHLDGSALDVAELPTAGALTLQFVQRQVVGGKLPPITVESSPAGFAAPTDVTLSTIVAPPTETTGDPNGQTALGVRGRLIGVRPFDQNTVVLPATVHADIPWVLESNGDFFTKGDIRSEGDIRADLAGQAGTGFAILTSGDFTYSYTNDVDYYISPITGISQIDAGGDNPEWRFDYTTGEWECISVALGARLWFPLQIRGQLRSVVWVTVNAAIGPLQDIALITETQDESSPFGKTVVASGTTSNGAVGTAQRNTVNFNTVLTQDTKDYYLRIQGATVGDRVRSLKVTVRKTRAGDGW